MNVDELYVVTRGDQLTQEQEQAYIILSNFFLDTQFTPSDLHIFSTSLRALGIPAATLQHMLRYDLFPFLYPNLLNIAGEWGGFDRDWLLQNVQDRRSGIGTGWMKSQVDRIVWFLIGHWIQSVWDKVKEGLNDDSNARL